MLVIGLTGGIGSGKSAALRQFRRMGAKVIDADKLARDVVRPGRPAWRDIREHFGPSVFHGNHYLDRKKLAQKVFGNAEALKALNGIIHPRVFEEEKRLIKKYGAKKNSVIVVDAPLMLETGSHAWKDAVVVVAATPEEQVQRLVKSGRFTKAEAQKRIASQMPLAEKLKHADYVIENHGTLAELRREAAAVYRRILKEHRSRLR